MHPDSHNHMTFDVSVGESAAGTANRRLRSRLETAFRDVRAQSADAAPEQRRELRASLREICAEARRAGLRAEQLLVLIKDVWSAMPAGISRVQSVHGDERLNEVILHVRRRILRLECRRLECRLDRGPSRARGFAITLRSWG